MHFITSWDIRATGEEWTRINEEFKTVLKPYSWVRPLTTLYIVNVETQEIWNKILADLQAVGGKYPGKVSLLLSPLMQGGHYDGLLGKGLWDEVNARSK